MARNRPIRDAAASADVAADKLVEILENFQESGLDVSGTVFHVPFAFNIRPGKDRREEGTSAAKRTP